MHDIVSTCGIQQAKQKWIKFGNKVGRILLQNMQFCRKSVRQKVTDVPHKWIKREIRDSFRQE